MREALWRVVVDSKYGSAWGGWCFNEVYEGRALEEYQERMVRVF